MNRKQLALKVLLPVLVALIIATLIFEIKCLDIHNDSENGMLYAIAILLNMLPLLAMIILGTASAIMFVLLLVAKNKRAVIKSTFVILCVLLPFTLFNAFIAIAALHIFIEVPIMAFSVSAVDIAALILCRTLLNEIK